MDILNKTQAGQHAEQKAFEHLQTKGLTPVARNYRCPYGEIDLIMRDREEMVFIEVRSRLYNDYGSALESVNPTKQKKLARSAIHFLQKRGLLDKIDCRFDVIGISPDEIEWTIDAFSTDNVPI